MDVGVVEYRAVVKNLPVIGLSAVLPLARNALTLTLYAPDPLEKEVREDFNEILSRITKASSDWRTPEEFRKIETIEMVGKAGTGLLALYPIVWLIFFRGFPMRAHWVRTAWFVLVAVLLFVPITSPGPTSLWCNLITNLFLPLLFISFAVRRVKLGIEMG